MIIRSNVPLYDQIMDDILNKIKGGCYESGKKIPSERALAEEYGVSRVTIRNTITELVHKGVLYRRHGSGTYVKEPSVESQLIRMNSLPEELRAMGMDVEIEVFSTDFIDSDIFLREKLELVNNSKVYRIIRRFYHNNRTLLVSYIHTHAEVGRKLENINLNRKTFLSSVEDFGYPIQYAREKIRAIRINDFEMKMLDVPPHTPAMCLEKTVYISRDKPLYITKAVINGDRYSVNVQLQRKI